MRAMKRVRTGQVFVYDEVVFQDGGYVEVQVDENGVEITSGDDAVDRLAEAAQEMPRRRGRPPKNPEAQIGQSAE